MRAKRVLGSVLSSYDQRSCFALSNEADLRSLVGQGAWCRGQSPEVCWMYCLQYKLSYRADGAACVVASAANAHAIEAVVEHGVAYSLYVASEIAHKTRACTRSVRYSDSLDARPRVVTHRQQQRLCFLERVAHVSELAVLLIAVVLTSYDVEDPRRTMRERVVANAHLVPA